MADTRKRTRFAAVDQPKGLRLVWACALPAYLGFVLAGSFAPFQIVTADGAQFFERTRPLWSGPWHIYSRSDVLANLLLFVPLGLLAMRVTARVLRAPQRLTGACVVWIACTALATAIELSQVFFPPRVVSRTDLLAESLGALFGIALWFQTGDRLEQWVARVVGGANRARLLRPPVALLACVLVGRALWPFDLTLSPVEIYRKHGAGLVHGVLRWEYWRNVAGRWADAALFALLGAAAALQQGARGRMSGRVVLAGTAFATILEFLQLFVVSRTSALDDVLLGSLSISLGWSLAALVAAGCRPETAHRT